MTLQEIIANPDFQSRRLRKERFNGASVSVHMFRSKKGRQLGASMLLEATLKENAIDNPKP